MGVSRKKDGVSRWCRRMIQQQRDREVCGGGTTRCQGVDTYTCEEQAEALRASGPLGFRCPMLCQLESDRNQALSLLPRALRTGRRKVVSRSDDALQCTSLVTPPRKKPKHFSPDLSPFACTRAGYAHTIAALVLVVAGCLPVPDGWAWPSANVRGLSPSELGKKDHTRIKQPRGPALLPCHPATRRRCRAEPETRPQPPLELQQPPSGAPCVA